MAHQTAIVTGGRGIGKETPILLSKMGLNVVICSMTQEIDSTEHQRIVIGTNRGGGVATEGRILGLSFECKWEISFSACCDITCLLCSSSVLNDLSNRPRL